MLVAIRSAHPLDMDQAVAEAWGQRAWADYSGVSRTLSSLSEDEVAALAQALEQVEWPLIHSELAPLRAGRQLVTIRQRLAVQQAWTDAEELLYVTGAITPTGGTGQFEAGYRLSQGIIGEQDLAKAAAELSTARWPLTTGPPTRFAC